MVQGIVWPLDADFSSTSKDVMV